MNASKWLFGCQFGLRQDTCGKYERDGKSRGASQGYGGCASCLHREPANEETRVVEREFRLERLAREANRALRGVRACPGPGPDAAGLPVASVL